MGKHTPGPWVCAEVSPPATGPAPHALLVGPKTVPLDRGHGWHIPDARLMAAAPELLAFAEWIAERHGEKSIEGQSARVAIAKATSP